MDTNKEGDGRKRQEKGGKRRDRVKEEKKEERGIEASKEYHKGFKRGS